MSGIITPVDATKITGNIETNTDAPDNNLKSLVAVLSKGEDQGLLTFEAEEVERIYSDKGIVRLSPRLQSPFGEAYIDVVYAAGFHDIYTPDEFGMDSLLLDRDNQDCPSSKLSDDQRILRQKYKNLAISTLTLARDPRQNKYNTPANTLINYALESDQELFLDLSSLAIASILKGDPKLSAVGSIREFVTICCDNNGGKVAPRVLLDGFQERFPSNVTSSEAFLRLKQEFGALSLKEEIQLARAEPRTPPQELQNSASALAKSLGGTARQTLDFLMREIDPYERVSEHAQIKAKSITAEIAIRQENVERFMRDVMGTCGVAVTPETLKVAIGLTDIDLSYVVKDFKAYLQAHNIYDFRLTRSDQEPKLLRSVAGQDIDISAHIQLYCKTKNLPLNAVRFCLYCIDRQNPDNNNIPQNYFDNLPPVFPKVDLQTALLFLSGGRNLQAYSLAEINGISLYFGSLGTMVYFRCNSISS